MNDNAEIYTLSPSQYTSFTHCRYAWYLSYRADCSQVWPGAGVEGLGIRLKDEYLPNPIKLGAIWDTFQNAYYNKERFSPDVLMELCDRYDLDDGNTAKMFGLVRAWHKMKFTIDLEGAEPQHEFKFKQTEFMKRPFEFHGIMDVKFPEYIVDNKLSGCPKRFQKVFNFHDQAATYLLAHPDAKSIIIRAVQAPMLKLGKAEDSEAFRDRIVKDIISRPSHYFLGYDREKGDFGIRFWRGEFDIEGLQKDFEHVFEDIQACVQDRGRCYQDKLSCYVPTQCMYLPVCETGGVSDTLYKPKQKQTKAAEAATVPQEVVEDEDN